MQQLLGVADLSGGTNGALDTDWTAWLARPGLAADAFSVHRSRSVAFGAGGSSARTTTEDGRFTLSLAGSLRDTQILQARIAERSGDSSAPNLQDILLAGLRLMGEEAACLVTGDFVCVLHDHEASTTICFRSREASRPLYYVVAKGALWFATDATLLCEVPGISAGLDYSAVSYFLSYGVPPPDRTLSEDVRRLSPGHLLKATRSGVVPERPIRSLVSTVRETRSLEDAAAAALAPFVAKRAVAVLAGADDPRSAWLAKIALRAGAARVAPGNVPDASADLRMRLQRASNLIASFSEPLADPWLPALAQAAHQAAASADLCLCAAGSTAIIPLAERHSRFMQGLACRDGAGAAQAQRTFYEGPLLKRDLYFREIAFFDDAARLAVSGPALAPSLVFAMADELGPLLEEATPDTAPTLAARLDRSLASGARLGLDAVSLDAGIPVMSPFLLAPVLDWAELCGGPDRQALADRFRDWPSREPWETMRGVAGPGAEMALVRTCLHAPAFAASGIVGAEAIEALIAEDAAGAPDAGLRLWTLCCLAMWLATLTEPRP